MVSSIRVGLIECSLCYGSGQTQYITDYGNMVFETCENCAGYGYIHERPMQKISAEEAFKAAERVARLLIERRNEK